MEVKLGGDITLGLLLDGDRYLGIGSVVAGGVALRSPRRPILPEIRTPNGIALRDFRLTAFDQGAQRVEITMTMDRSHDGLMEWMSHEVRPRYAVHDWSAAPEPAPDTTLSLSLEPVGYPIGEWHASGFQYQYRYRTVDLPIYKILDRATWEVGGDAVGNEIWIRNSFAPAIEAIAEAGQRYSTEWYLPSCHNPAVFQFLPWQTALPGFTFTAHARGVLITWGTEVSHVRTLLEKEAGKREIAHWHEHCGDLAPEFSTCPIDVLWIPGPRSRTELFNLYHAVQEMVADRLHACAGLRRERVSTYGMIEEWGLPDLDEYRRRAVPALLAAGVKRIFLPSQFQNNMNVWGLGNMCCTVDYKVADSVGEDRLKALVEDVEGGGAEVEMWGNTAVSTLSWIFANRERTGTGGPTPSRIDFLPREGSLMEALRTAEEPFVRNPSGAIEADHYTPVFAVLNLRDRTVRDYWLRCWGAARERIGRRGIFVDSSCNLSSDKFHWVANADATRIGAVVDQAEPTGRSDGPQGTPSQILSQYGAYLDLLREMQETGYAISAEDVGVFGVHKSGPDLGRRLDSLPLWSDCLLSFDRSTVLEAGEDPDDVYFRGLAYRMMWMLYWDPFRGEVTFTYPDPDRQDCEPDTPSVWHLSLLRAYNAVEKRMAARRILPEGRGVLYAARGPRIDGSRQTDRISVLWAFEDFDMDCGAGCNIRDVLSGTAVRGDRLSARKHHIYTLTSSVGRRDETERGNGRLRAAERPALSKQPLVVG